MNIDMNVGLGPWSLTRAWLTPWTWHAHANDQNQHCNMTQCPLPRGTCATGQSCSRPLVSRYTQRGADTLKWHPLISIELKTRSGELVWCTPCDRVTGQTHLCHLCCTVQAHTGVHLLLAELDVDQRCQQRCWMGSKDAACGYCCCVIICL